MDKLWMSKNRLSDEYEVGVDAFLKFTVEMGCDANFMARPCAKCANTRKHKLSIVKGHIIMNGMDMTYQQWIWHGEDLMRHLYSNMRENGTASKFLFVNLFTIDYGVKQEDRARTLSQRLLDDAASDVLVFVPCNVGGHWILTIIQVEKGQAFLMDPLCHRNKDNTWKSIVDTAISTLTARKGKKMKKANWEVIKKEADVVGVRGVREWNVMF